MAEISLSLSIAYKQLFNSFINSLHRAFNYFGRFKVIVATLFLDENNIVL